MMKTIAIMQPVYLPWLGYFEQMALADEFMFLDDVQYTKNDWRNRNRIRTIDGWMWVTVPVRRASLKKHLGAVEINYDHQWPRHQLRAIRRNYAPTLYFGEFYGMIEAAYGERPKRLVDLTIPLVRAFADFLGINPPITLSSAVARSSNSRLERIVELCRARGAGRVYTGPAAQSYMDIEFMHDHQIEIAYQDYQHPVYRQHFEGFESHMSIIDLLMNCGPKSRDILLSSPKPKWFPRTD
ncbi:WbqC family protein [Parasphingopyxis sp. CP4]|uniref:WbqC family protein n=1 Tax=Parasphingopyxis sp. CP4 TaxID=2724527 RepID=UPI0015A1AF01|nr:WbqC family protein [Parasphingopyxis sp. CP4]QLC22269.1 WbqC family protein [Parasphingopyxis sp. CP4]